MRAVLQRVRRASVVADGETSGSIDAGWLVLFGVEQEDSVRDLEYICEKTAHLRAFKDEVGKMNRSVLDIGGALLLVSQFTLCGDTRSGRRPSFSRAAPPDKAKALYEEATVLWRNMGLRVETGVFGADMTVSLENDGPVTFILDSEDSR